MSSEFTCEVVPVQLRPHPNADTLSLVTVFDNYQVVVKTAEWEGVKTAVYVPPETVVPNRAPYYEMLAGDPAFTKFVNDMQGIVVKTRKFRGERSYGLLLPVSEEFAVGTNMADFLGFTHYEPKLLVQGKRGPRGATDVEFSKPAIKGPFYDIQNWRKFSSVFEPGEPVVISEKIHGCNARFTYQGGEFHVASRTYYRKRFFYKDKPKNWWKRFKWFVKHTICRVPREVWNNDSFYWKAFKDAPGLMKLCQDNPGVIFYGEIYGKVQAGYPYDSTKEEPFKVRLFDACVKDIKSSKYQFLDYANLYDLLFKSNAQNLMVPIDWYGSYGPALVEKLCEAPSQLGKHIREGVVIKPATERTDPRLGRVILKCVNPKYLEKL